MCHAFRRPIKESTIIQDEDYSFALEEDSKGVEMQDGSWERSASEKIKLAYFRHLNEDVYVRTGEDICKTIPGARQKDSVVLTRLEIETYVLDAQVRDYIYDLIPPDKHKVDNMTCSPFQHRD